MRLITQGKIDSLIKEIYFGQSFVYCFVVSSCVIISSNALMLLLFEWQRTKQVLMRNLVLLF